MAEEKKMNLFQKLLLIQDEIQTVAKNLNVETGNGKGYKAVSERDVIDAVKPIEKKYGVYSYPSAREILQADTLESETKYGKKTTFFTRIQTTYRFVNADNPTEFIEMTTYAEGIDSQDKGSGKAMTYADKYALMKAYKISTGDDPDQNASVPEQYVSTTGEVSNEKKKVLMNTCKAMGLDCFSLLGEIGWNRGDKLTEEQYAKALVLVKKYSDEAEKKAGAK